MMFKLIPVCLLVVSLVLSGIPNTAGSGENHTKLAFSASVTQTHNLPRNSLIKFDNVETNIGNGYDPSTGIFTAHEPGVYAFSANFIKGYINYAMELNLMKNNDLIARGYANEFPLSSGSFQVIISLKKGDQISLRQPQTSAVVCGYKYSMFTGHMI